MTEQRMFNKNVRDLDPEIWSLARKAELGELRAIYHAVRRRTRSWVIGWIVLVYGLLGLLAGGGMIATSWPDVSFFWALPGLLLFAGGCYLLFSTRRYAHWHVYLWEAGFVSANGPVRQVFRWNQIESIQGRQALIFATDSAAVAYKVRRQDGYEVTLDNAFVNNAELVNAVAEAFLREATARELVVAPRNQTFSLFTLDRQGLRDKDHALSWQQIEEITIEKGSMTILKCKTNTPTYEQKAGEHL